jgi:hypothetical protein
MSGARPGGSQQAKTLGAASSQSWLRPPFRAGRPLGSLHDCAQTTCEPGYTAKQSTVTVQVDCVDPLYMAHSLARKLYNTDTSDADDTLHELHHPSTPGSHAPGQWIATQTSCNSKQTLL